MQQDSFGQTAPARKVTGIFAIIIIATLVVGGLLYWQFGRNSCEGEICKFMSAWDDTETYRVVGKETLKDSSITTTIQSIGQGQRLSIARKNTMSSAYNTETIILQSTAYIKSPAGEFWWYQKMSKEDVDAYKKTLSDFQPPHISLGVTDGARYVKKGTSRCGSLQCLKYELALDGVQTTVSLWFDTKDYKLRRMVRQEPVSRETYDYTYDEVSVASPRPLRPLARNQRLELGSSQPITAPVKR